MNHDIPFFPSDNSGGNNDVLENYKQQIEEATGETYEDLTEAVKDAVDKAEDSNTWYELTGEKTSLLNGLFSRTTTVKKLPRMNFENVTDMIAFANASQIETIDYYINSGKATNFSNAFYRCRKLRFIYGVDLSACTNLYEAFKQCDLLETIQEPLDISNVVGDASGAFVDCPSLKDIRFVENCIKVFLNWGSCSSLTPESVDSIINGLATVETAQTLKFHANVKAKLTKEQIATITNKNWTLA